MHDMHDMHEGRHAPIAASRSTRSRRVAIQPVRGGVPARMLPRLAATLAALALATTIAAAPPDIPEVMVDLPSWTAADPAAVVRKLEAVVRTAGADPALRAALARQLDGVLIGASTPDAKDVALRALATIGDAGSIDAVAPLLKDARLGHLAVATLAVLPDRPKEGPTALLAAALADAAMSDALRVAVIDALRRRGGEAALRAVMEAAGLRSGLDSGLGSGSGTGTVRSAAITALGGWRPSAAAALVTIAPQQIDDPARRALFAALLGAAEERMASTDAPSTTSLLDHAQHLAGGDHDALAVARLRLRASGDDAATLVALLNDARPAWRGTALEVVRSDPARGVTAQAIAALPRVSAEARAELVAALGARGDRAARDAVVALTASDDAPARLAAIGALRSLGDARDVPLLVDALSAADPAVAQAATETLIAMKDGRGGGDGGDGGDGSVDRTLGDRIVAASATLGAAATSDVARDTEVQHLLDILVQRPGAAPTKAIALALRSPGTTRLAAIKAMHAYPAPHFATLLGGLAHGQGDPPSRAPAFAAWIACLGAPGVTPPEWGRAALADAMQAATTDEERASVAAMATRFPERSSLEFLAPLLAPPVGGEPQPALVRNAARDATLAIARALPRDQRRDALAAIDRAIAASPADDAPFRAAAAAAINEIERDLDFIRSWQIAGPLERQGTTLAGLFDTTFAPETEPDGDAVVWCELAGSALGADGVIDLAKFLGAGENRVAYLRTHLFSPRAQRARLEIGSDDGVKVWLNGALVHGKNAPRGVRPGEDIVAVDLREGWNTLLLKVTQGAGDWAVCCRVRGADGRASEGVNAFVDPARAAPLPGATILLGDAGLGAWRQGERDAPRWTFADNVATVTPGSGDIRSRELFDDCTLHVEFLCPDTPPNVTGQRRSNSGIFLQDRYEVQVLDSFGDGPAKDRVGAIYGKHVPAHDVARRPDQWQDALIDFTAPRWDLSNPAAPRKVANARMTVWLNGVRIHDDVEVDSFTTTGVTEAPGAAPVRLQDHGDPVRFRNVWIVPRSGWEGPGAAGFTPLFDGASLTGWTRRGGKASFSVADGTLVGETRPNESNSFLCSREFGDFVLELEFLADNAANSGIQFRSAARAEQGGERVVGYQCEIDPSNRGWTAGIYDEARRGWLAPPRTPRAKDAYLPDEWNKLRIEARGPDIRTWLNDVPVSVLWDALSPRGFFGLQVHGVGDRVEPLRVRWRDLRVREIGGAASRPASPPVDAATGKP